MKKVLEMFGEPITYGGQESVVYNMLSTFDLKNDFSIDLFTPYFADNKDLISLILNNNGKIYTLNLPFKNFDNRFNLIKPVSKFFEECKENYDVVHIHTGSLTTMYVFAKIAKRSGVKKVIVHSHIGLLSGGYIGKLRRLILNVFMSRYVDVYLGCSKEAIDAKFIGKARKNAIIIHNGIDIEKFKYNEKLRNEIREKYKINNKFVLGSLGRISEQKNHIFMIDMYNDLLKELKSKNISKDIVLLIVGGGELLEDIKNKVMELDLNDSVIFVGNQPDSYKFYQSFDIFLQPSIYEGLPVTAIEAQVSGLPCLLSDNISKECAIIKEIKFLSINDEKNWIDNIIKIINTNIDRESKDIDYDKFDKKKTYTIIGDLYKTSI